MARNFLRCSTGFYNWSHYIWSHIHLCDLLIIVRPDIGTFLDHNTPYMSGENSKSFIQPLESTACRISKWFSENQQKGIGDKCLVLLNAKDRVVTKVDSAQIENRYSEKLLGAIVDKKLSFEGHIKTLCGKVRSKPNALSRVVPLIKLNKRKLLINAFFKAQFKYCHLVQIVHSHKLNKNVNRLHERCLGVTSQDHKTSFEELLKVDISVSVQYKNLRCLAIEFY